MDTGPDIDPAEAMLAQLAGLDLTLARHVHACAMATEDPAEVASLSQAYQRISRCVRQSLALHARMKRERERAEREAASRPKAPPPAPPYDPERIAERETAVRQAAQRVVWSEYEHAEDEDESGYFFDLIDQRLAQAARDDTFGLVVEQDGWTEEHLDAHVVRFCRSLGLSGAAAQAWRDLPDQPAVALASPADDEDDEGEDRDVHDSA